MSMIKILSDTSVVISAIIFKPDNIESSKSVQPS